MANVWSVLLIGFSTLFVPNAAFSQDFRLGVTTSIDNSGLAAHIAPKLEKVIDGQLRIIVAGSGQLLSLAKNGDVDATITHSPKAEKAHIENGFASHRVEVFQNRFVIIGPKNDPLRLSSSASIDEAFQNIHQNIRQNKAQFISRADDSGTHQKEVQIWQNLGLDVTQKSPDLRDWYINSGLAMGATLNMAAARNAYTLSDSASWLSFKNKSELGIVFDQPQNLSNIYAFMPAKRDIIGNDKHAMAQKIQRWLTSKKGQKTIMALQVNGTPLFQAIR